MTQSRRGRLNKTDGHKIGRSMAIAFGAALIVILARKFAPGALGDPEGDLILQAALAVILNTGILMQRGPGRK